MDQGRNGAIELHARLQAFNGLGESILNKITLML